MISKPEYKIPELLAPAGSKEALQAVLEAGADSVYVAGKLFGMRQHASWLNFSEEGLSEAIRMVRDYGKNIYVTVNNLLTRRELGLVERFLDFLALEQPDAVIVQDLGLIHLCRSRDFPVPLHASTMMNVYDTETASFLGELGITRVVTSRDITLRRSVQIQQESGVECEVFLHGDMCISHGGQCLTSGILTGESANRGKCLKPCRWQYEMVRLTDIGTPLANPHEGNYLLARKDLSLLEHLGAVAGSGIAALKVEGRARKPEFLRYVVSEYRRALDRYAENPESFDSQEYDLDQWKAQRIRNQSTCYTFGNPQAESIDYSGKREPRFFSIAVEQAKHRPHTAAGLATEPMFGDRPNLAVHCGSIESAAAAIDSGADCVRLDAALIRNPESASGLETLLEDCESRTEFGIVLDRVLSPTDWRFLARGLERIRRLGIDHVVTSSLPAATVIRNCGMKAVGDYGLNVFNVEALDFLVEQGFDLATLSLEMNLDQVSEIVMGRPGTAECVVHGPLTGMLTEHCLLNASFGEGREVGSCRDLCEGKSYGLRNLMGQIYPVITDLHCRNHILLPLDLCGLAIIPQLCDAGVASVRVEGRYSESTLVAAAVACYRRALDSAVEGKPVDWETEDSYRDLVELSPRGFSLGAYAGPAPEIAAPGEGLPTDLWIKQDETEAPTLVPVEMGSLTST